MTIERDSTDTKIHVQEWAVALYHYLGDLPNINEITLVDVATQFSDSVPGYSLDLTVAVTIAWLLYYPTTWRWVVDDRVYRRKYRLEASEL